MLYWLTKISQNGTLKSKLKHYGGGKIYSHSIIYGHKILDTIGVSRATLCVNNDIENKHEIYGESSV